MPRTEAFHPSHHVCSTASILALTSSGVNLCMSFTASEERRGSSSGASALLMWIWRRQRGSAGVLYYFPCRGMAFLAQMQAAYHRHVHVVQVSPGLGRGLDNVDLAVGKRPCAPDGGEGRFRANAEPAVRPREQGDPAGLLQETRRWLHVGENISCTESVKKAPCRK